MANTARKALHAYLSPDAYQGWINASDELGVSLSGLLEAFGLDLAEHAPGSRKGTGHPRWDELVERTRRIDASRRRRRVPTA